MTSRDRPPADDAPERDDMADEMADEDEPEEPGPLDELPEGVRTIVLGEEDEPESLPSESDAPAP